MVARWRSLREMQAQRALGQTPMEERADGKPGTEKHSREEEAEGRACSLLLRPAIQAKRQGEVMTAMRKLGLRFGALILKNRTILVACLHQAGGGPRGPAPWR